MSALSTKISSVLSTSYADLEIRDALDTLDSRGVKNSQETRRNLRLDVQREIIECNGEIIDDFGAVAKQLQRTGDALASLQQTCTDLRKHINAARTESKPVIDEATNLMSLRQQVESKQQILRDFNAHFLLSDDDQRALMTSADPINEDLFQALVKAKRVHKDCRVLLGGENQRLGLEILERSSKDLDSAFQRLFRWIQREFKTLDLENPSMSLSMRRALRVLAERPTLFQECLDTFAEVRERSLSDGFYAALTGSTTGKEAQKPIEFSAGEPLRYVGDMLAWAHSTAVSERESLEVLFISEGNEIAKSIEEGLESEPWSRPESGEVFDGRKALGQLVNRNLAGVARLLRQRIEEVIKTHQEPDLVYKLANLIVFYRGIFKKLLEEDDFLRTLDGLEKTALQQFQVNMAARLARVDSDELEVPDDLSAPEFLEECLDQLRELLKSYETSGAAADSDGSALNTLLEEALTPFLNRCQELSRSLKPPSSICFSMNCIITTRATLANFTCTSDRVEDLNNMLRGSISQLVEHQHLSFLRSGGLSPLVDALDDLPAATEKPSALLEHKAFSEPKLVQAQQQLDDFLSSAQMDALNELKSIKNSTLSHEIVNRAAERFCGDFERLEEAIDAADEEQRTRDGAGHEDARTVRTLFPRTSEEIRILLS